MTTPLTRGLAALMSSEDESRGLLFWFLELIALGCVLVAIEDRFAKGEIVSGFLWLFAGFGFGCVGFGWVKYRAKLPRLKWAWPSEIPWHFESRALLAEIKSLRLDLSSPEPSITFIATVANVCGADIEVSAIKGKVGYGSSKGSGKCGEDPVLDLTSPQRSRLRLPDGSYGETVTIWQPIKRELADLLMSALADDAPSAIVQFSLFHVELVGTLESSRGSVTLPACQIFREPFVAKGPMNLKGGDPQIIKTQWAPFVSQEFYDGAGNRR